MEFKNTPWHFGKHCAGTVNLWMPSDTKENFDRLMQNPKHQQYFEQQGWLEPSAITYKINSQGFRCDEFVNNEPCMIALGCSFTVGIGLPIETIWPTLVGKKLGLKVYNLAWGGTAADTCFRMAEYWVPQLRPKLVCMLTPPPARIELLQDSRSQPSEVFLPSNEIGTKDYTDTYLKHWFSVDENARVNSEKNKLAIRQICHQLNIPFMLYDSMTEMSKSREEIGYARDYMHAGPVGHQMLADKIVRDYYGS